MDTQRTSSDDLAPDVNYVLLAGGMSHMPAVRSRLREMFPKAQVFDDPGDGIRPDESIVAGLADTVGYHNLSMYRPAFDIVLDWSGGTHTLYEAYTPLFTPDQIRSGRSALGFEFRFPRRSLPQSGQGHLRAVSPSGQRVPLQRSGETLDVLPVRFGSHESVFKLYADGRILFTDGSGFHHEVRLDGWRPVIGRDHRPPRTWPQIRAPYPFNLDD
jgi:hypothetical protein